MSVIGTSESCGYLPGCYIVVTERAPRPLVVDLLHDQKLDWRQWDKERRKGKVEGEIFARMVLYDGRVCSMTDTRVVD